MTGKRSIAAATLVLGIGIGLAAGPLLNTRSAHAATTTTYHYTCLRPSAINTGINAFNTSSKPATVHVDDGTVTGGTNVSIPGHSVYFDGISAGQGNRPVRFTSNRKLLVDGNVQYEILPENQWQTWQIRCT